MGNPPYCAKAGFRRLSLFSQISLSLFFGVAWLTGCAHLPETQKNDPAASANSSSGLTNPADAVAQSPKTAQAKTSAWEQWKRVFPWTRNPPETVSDQTVELVRKYIQDENLDGINLEWRNRDASLEWQRLKQNGRISPVVRYSAGSLHWTAANLRPPFFPPRTHYDPYSDTIYLQSNDPVPILAGLAMAKTLRHSPLPGGQAVTSNVPVLSIYTRVAVAREVQAFARKLDDWELEKQSYRDLYPGLFSGSGVLTAAFVPFYVMPLIDVGGMAVGMVMGEAAIQMREAEIRQTKAQPVQASREQRQLYVPDAPPPWAVAQKP